jgi:hypothetical protein
MKHEGKPEETDCNIEVKSQEVTVNPGETVSTWIGSRDTVVDAWERLVFNAQHNLVNASWATWVAPNISRVSYKVVG